MINKICSATYNFSGKAPALSGTQAFKGNEDKPETLKTPDDIREQRYAEALEAAKNSALATIKSGNVRYQKTESDKDKIYEIKGKDGEISYSPAKGYNEDQKRNLYYLAKYMMWDDYDQFPEIQDSLKNPNIPVTTELLEQIPQDNTYLKAALYHCKEDKEKAFEFIKEAVRIVREHDFERAQSW